MLTALTVVVAGPLTLITDLGRPGHAHLGVPPSGALDPGALRLANRLVGNDEGAAGLEVLLGGLTLRAETACTVALTGPSTAVAVDDREHDSHTALRIPAGALLRVGTPRSGLRTWLAVAGGLDAPTVLGSRATDVLSGLGPAPLRDGDRLRTAAAPGEPAAVDVVVPTAVADPLTVPMLLGPRDDWVAVLPLRDRVWTVSPSSNRIGLRLQGEPLRRLVDRELPSEPVVTGAVQVPAGGQPVIFLADHPVTGGYPVIGVVDPAALPALAQARPGTGIRLRVH